eukprot:TRINITY_DN13496_c0_g1_i1.p1 TRINITY_DN13496_c0_g1~~TRINITY_DN13496_c0_g1_i1.p1  ORF type:complete len:195 (+),score=52.85 TRINITY_DN13496_c0_g1_i1:71-655(+)
MDGIVDVLEEAALSDDVQGLCEQFALQWLPVFEELTDDELQRAANVDLISSRENRCPRRARQIARLHLELRHFSKFRLQWHEAYKAYTSFMEERVLDACLADEPSLTKEAVYAELTRIAEAPADDADAAEGRSTARFLLSMFEYESFLELMKEQLRQKRAGVGFRFSKAPAVETAVAGHAPDAAAGYGACPPAA